MRRCWSFGETLLSGLLGEGAFGDAFSISILILVTLGMVTGSACDSLTYMSGCLACIIVCLPSLSSSSSIVIDRMFTGGSMICSLDGSLLIRMLFSSMGLGW